MTFDDWIRIANDIKKSYVSYDGFVVLHGTDTLSYTACALSFMMENLGKPVVITGSQVGVNS
jgi:L-asparaginase